MTVKQLRDLLVSLPDDLPVAIPRFSEYEAYDVAELKTLDLFDNRGYLSRAYRDTDRALATPHLVIE